MFIFSFLVRVFSAISDLVLSALGKRRLVAERCGIFHFILIIGFLGMFKQALLLFLFCNMLSITKFVFFVYLVLVPKVFYIFIGMLIICFSFIIWLDAAAEFVKHLSQLFKPFCGEFNDMRVIGGTDIDFNKNFIDYIIFTESCICKLSIAAYLFTYFAYLAFIAFLLF